MLEEGYALKRIADDIQTSGLDVVLSWIPGEAADRAMSLIDEFKKVTLEPEILESRAELPFDEDASYDEPSLSLPPSKAYTSITANALINGQRTRWIITLNTLIQTF